MGSPTFILICAAEVAAVLLFIIVVLLFKNRKLHNIMLKLKGRASEMKMRIKELSTQPALAIEPTKPEESYRDKLTQQLEITKKHHSELGSQREIALDLDPDAPLPRRTAALRNAFLIAEKEASSDVTDTINWDFLANRYQKLVDFNTDYSDADQAPPHEEQTKQLLEEIEQLKKRIQNLDRFKSMYFELESQWDKCKKEADSHYSELKTMTIDKEHQESFDAALENYHSSYDSIAQSILHISDGVAQQATGGSKHQSEELSRLRSVAADQHRIISQLQEQLKDSSDHDEQLHIMDAMQSELQKQARFLQESETCIQLMDNELTTANKELELLRDKAKSIPQLKSALRDLKASSGTQGQIAAALKHENNRLTAKLKEAATAPKVDGNEAKQLKKELSALQANYNDLEERYLDLKSQG